MMSTFQRHAERLRRILIEGTGKQKLLVTETLDQIAYEIDQQKRPPTKMKKPKPKINDSGLKLVKS